MAFGLIGFGRDARRPRRVALVAMVLAVVAIHGCVTSTVLSRMADIDAQEDMPARMEVAYVREMALSAPPEVATPAAPVQPSTAPHRAPRRIAKPAKAASAPKVLPQEEQPPVVAASAAASAVDPSASAPEPAPSQVVAALDASSAAASAAPGAARSSSTAASASAVPNGFEWPVSTRLSFDVDGNYRGDIKGSAQVEWIRDGSHYQVHVDVLAGPSSAPIATRRSSSDGEITVDGLVPRRYDEDTKVLMSAPRRRTIMFDPSGGVVLANGDWHANVAGLQDQASQFVQLSYVFSTRPEMLRIGSSVDIPLALPNRVDVWTYDVVGNETVNTSFGALQTIHLKPRGERKPNAYSVEMWFAPQLRYLPVRIHLEQSAEVYFDLRISKPPDIAN
jgi:Protein of unknown function (DUF3108)